MDETILKQEEKAVFALRGLYRQYGYLPYKMSKFEEYELYLRNKDFLVSDRIITFNDTDGKLMALKPDVTLSIIKNGEDVPGCKQKVCYNENVYRVSDSTHQYKEILQAGLECIGDVDLYDFFEVISLAARSLSLISEDFVLDISHLGILTGVLDELCTDDRFQKQAIDCIAGKNAHDLRRLCGDYGVSDEGAARLAGFIEACGERRSVMDKLETLCGEREQAALGELRDLSALLDTLPFASRIRFDFSVVNHLGYYNGFVFRGFLNGICSGVLAGGQYDKLMGKMGRTAGAIGFALYLDLLEQLPTDKSHHDVDVLLLYTQADSKAAVARAVAKLTAKGLTVSAQKSVPPKLRCGQVIPLGQEETVC